MSTSISFNRPTVTSSRDISVVNTQNNISNRDSQPNPNPSVTNSISDQKRNN